MTEYYTGTGDNGDTGILASGRVSKASAIIEAIGSVDELNSAIGMAYCRTDDKEVRQGLETVQNDLFIIGANLASLANPKVRKAALSPSAVKRLEEQIAKLSKGLPELKEFVLPGGTEAAAELHMARAIARRAERDMARASKEGEVDSSAKAYMNRLSSYLFVASLYLNMKSGREERHPSY